MKTSESVAKLYEALFNFQGAMKPIPRSKVVKVKSYEFRYAPLDAIMETIVPLLQREGLAVAQAVDDSAITTRLMHKSGEWMESSTFLNRDHANMQGFGGEITYKRRYSLCSLLGIVSDDDNDVPRFSATQGALDSLTPRRKNLITDIAEIIKEKFSESNEYGAYEEYLGVTDQEERTALWSLLPSKIRTALTALNKKEREGATV